MHLRSGTGDWELVNRSGFSLLFASEDGTIVSYCPFGCEIWGTVSKDHPVQLILREGDIDLYDVSKADIFLSHGNVTGSNLQELDLHLSKGSYDLSLCSGSKINIQGYHLDGKLFLCDGIWNHRIREGVNKVYISSHNEAIGSYSIQYATGSLDILSDSIADLLK
ncbi:MAG: hypothetical protein VX278_17915 [Myxococcota bacterium]|nr:hypothetical protein [Myxococcota bacterium]